MIFTSYLALALLASTALGAGTAWLVVRWSKKPLLWLLAPVFALLWLAVGVTPLVVLAFSVQRSPGPSPPVLAPIEAAPAKATPAP